MSDVSSGTEQAYDFVVDDLMSRFLDRRDLSTALKTVLPIVQSLVTGEWTAETRLQVQGALDDALRRVGLI